jgi:hypothetical protein
MTHDYQISSTPYTNQEHKIVEYTAELPLSQGAFLVDPYVKKICVIFHRLLHPHNQLESTL